MVAEQAFLRESGAFHADAPWLSDVVYFCVAIWFLRFALVGAARRISNSTSLGPKTKRTKRVERNRHLNGERNHHEITMLIERSCVDVFLRTCGQSPCGPIMVPSCYLRLVSFTLVCDHCDFLLEANPTILVLSQIVLQTLALHLISLTWSIPL